jgi:hypothetical protein
MKNLLESIHQCVFEPSDDGIHLPEICKKCKEKKSVHHLINESHSNEEGKKGMSNHEYILMGLKLTKYDEMVQLALKSEKAAKKSTILQRIRTFVNNLLIVS